LGGNICVLGAKYRYLIGEIGEKSHESNYRSLSIEVIVLKIFFAIFFFAIGAPKIIFPPAPAKLSAALPTTVFYNGIWDLCLPISVI
jgi:hypothetical protein